MSDYAEERKNRSGLKSRKIIRDFQRQRGEETKGQSGKPVSNKAPEIKGRFDPKPPSRPHSPALTAESYRILELERDLEQMTLVHSTQTNRSLHSQLTMLMQTNQQLRDENRRLKRDMMAQRNRRVYQEEEMMIGMQLAAMNDEALDLQAVREVQMEMALNRADLSTNYTDPALRQRILEELANSHSAAVRDSLSYEEMLALEERIGSVPVGLSSEQLERLPVTHYHLKAEEPCTLCSICMVDFTPSEDVVELPKCRHLYHPPCIKRWLQGKKTCPLCLEEVR